MITIGLHVFQLFTIIIIIIAQSISFPCWRRGDHWGTQELDNRICMHYIGACQTYLGALMGQLVLVVQQFPERFHLDEPLGWLATIHLDWKQVGVC
jgi:hypothetical protein